MLGGQNEKKKLKKRDGSWKTAVAGSVSWRQQLWSLLRRLRNLHDFDISSKNLDFLEMIKEFGVLFEHLGVKNRPGFLKNEF